MNDTLYYLRVVSSWYEHSRNLNKLQHCKAPASSCKKLQLTSMSGTWTRSMVCWQSPTRRAETFPRCRASCPRTSFPRRRRSDSTTSATSRSRLGQSNFELIRNSETLANVLSFLKNRAHIGQFLLCQIRKKQIHEICVKFVRKR